MAINLANLLQQGSAVGPQLHRILRDSIIRGETAPGMRISETEIAAIYAVSRQPVREAFIKLAEEGLVEIRPQRGTFVSLISVQAVMTARFIREAVEADIVRQLAGTAGDPQIVRLESCLTDQQSLSPDAPAEDFMRLDEEFHRLLAELVGLADVADHLEAMKIQMNRVRHISARKMPRARLIAQHANVVEAIRSRDPDRAEMAMRQHLREILADLPEIVTAQSEYFAGAARLAM